MLRRLVFAFAALSMLPLTAASCADDEEVASNEDDLGASARSYVTVTRDYRKCASPMCGGFWVQDVNRVEPKKVYVSDFDFARAGLTPELEQVVRSAEDYALVLRGKLGPLDAKTKTRKFQVSEAYRGMPGVTLRKGDRFYQLDEVDIQCIAAPCSIGQARLLNKTAGEGVHGLSVEEASLERVDQNWLSNRLHRRDAIALATVRDGEKQPAGVARVLDASQVFVKLPDHLGPCGKPYVPACAPDETQTFVRDENRCIGFDQCVKPGACAAFVPECAEGYTLTSLTSAPFACNAYFCEPNWLLESQ